MQTQCGRAPDAGLHRYHDGCQPSQTSGNLPTPAMNLTLKPSVMLKTALLTCTLCLVAGCATPVTAQESTFAPLLRHLQVGVGDAIVMVPLEEVVYLEAADKYVRVLTADQEYLVRISLRELLPQLDAQRFWQVHRGHIVHVDAIDRVHRDESGKLTLRLRHRPEKLAVRRMYGHLFRAM